LAAGFNAGRTCGRHTCFEKERGDIMASIYDEIVCFMEAYFPAYSEKGQIAETQHIMDGFYAPELTFDEGIINSREQWYKACLAHPAVQDKITLEHLAVDEKQKEVSALCKTQAIDRATGNVLVELKMHVLYNLKLDENSEFKIARVRVFLETDPLKASRLIQVYRIN
jgi:hypothetical protein